MAESNNAATRPEYSPLIEEMLESGRAYTARCEASLAARKSAKPTAESEPPITALETSEPDSEAPALNPLPTS